MRVKPWLLLLLPRPVLLFEGFVVCQQALVLEVVIKFLSVRLCRFALSELAAAAELVDAALAVGCQHVGSILYAWSCSANVPHD